MKYFLSSILIALFLFSPLITLAQVNVGTSPAGALNPTNPTSQLNQLGQQTLANQKAACLANGYYWLTNNTCSKTSTQSAQVLQRFRPGVDIQTTGKNIGGINFSGVGSSVLGCLDVGGKVVNGISNLFKKKISTKEVSQIASKFNFSNPASQAVPTTDATTQKKIDEEKAKLDEIKKKETCLDAIAYTLSRQALSQVTNKTLTYINTGFGGDPFYVKNMDSFLGSIRNEQIRSYIGIADNISKSNGDAVGPDVTNKLIEILTGRTSPTTSPTTPAQQKYDAFTNDFSNGGWDSWYRMTQLGENPIAGILTSSQELGRTIAQQQDNARQQLLQNNGFLSAQVCTQTDPVNKNPDGTPKCLKYEVTTPGAVIASQAQTITNSATRQLEAADELNEVLGGFFDNMLNKLIQKGLNGLQKETSRSLGGNYYSASLTSNGNVGGVDMGYQSSGDGYNTQDFDISRPQQLRAVTQTQADFLSAAQDSQIAMERILPSVGALDYCIPGPNPSWQDGLDQNFGAFINSFETPTKSSSLAAKLLSSIPIIGAFFSSADKEIQYALIGEPVLTDKVTTGQVAISPWSYFYYTSDYSRGVHNTDGDWIRGWISGGYDKIVQKYQTNFTLNSITQLFTAVDPNVAYATGAIKDSVAETANLLGYQQTITSLDTQYDQIISDKEDQLAELNDILSEANSIVKVAKARYIANQATLGTPVNLSCINKAYVIDQSPVVSAPRQESDTPNPMLQQMLDANDYFYTTL